ncbi:hypothetical protein GJ700_02970 [Duganella sp. FT92W]|uniref:Uncharacterized protein n=2 Tax=Pseudoduganella rivuli TaxID=2666085 RepID=A0A7X2LPU5_9BURK|nr:hypothetical protein [Pseudoduganella rivuli]
MGINETLRVRGLQGLAGQNVEAIFVGLIDVICPPGGPIDEAIARQALMEAIGDQADAGSNDFDTLTPAQLKEFFLDFVVRSIEGRIISDIGAKGVVLPDNVNDVLVIQEQLHDFIAGCCHSHLATELDAIGTLTDRQLDAKINLIYEAAFSLIEEAGEEAE